jgi:ATP-dependent RNA helicase RhlE
MGHDLLGCAQTGTGKTAAFALPVLHHIARATEDESPPRPIRALVLTPTRELAAQVRQSFSTYGEHLSLRTAVIFGGVSQRPQVAALRSGIDILVATPGRLLDLCSQGFIDLSQVEHFILDEADRMLDMGFIHDIRKVLKMLPMHRQNLLFSATMPKAIVKLASDFLHEPVQVSVTPQASTVDQIDQHIMFVNKAKKRDLLVSVLEDDRWDIGQTIVFTRTKHGANRLVQHLQKRGHEAAAIHGNKSQGARERALGAFHRGDLPVLVATDVAARGLDVDGITHVVNFDLPNEPESYVHRIGRTGRAGRRGVAIAFHQEDDYANLRGIEKLTGVRLMPILDQPFHSHEAMTSKAAPAKKQGNRDQRNRGRNGQGRGRGGPKNPARGRRPRNKSYSSR